WGEGQAHQSAEAAVRELGDAAVSMILREFCCVPPRGGIESPSARPEPMAEAGDQIDRSLRLAVAPVVEDRVGLADPVRRAPEVHRHVETGVNSQLVGQIDRRGAGGWNIGVSRISLAVQRVGAGKRCYSSLPVETNAVVRVSSGDA